MCIWIHQLHALWISHTNSLYKDHDPLVERTSRLYRGQHARTHAHPHARAHIHTCTHAHAHTCTHTHTHTYILAFNLWIEMIHNLILYYYWEEDFCFGDFLISTTSPWKYPNTTIVSYQFHTWCETWWHIYVDKYQAIQLYCSRNFDPNDMYLVWYNS
jgi:hypothetical protein